MKHENIAAQWKAIASGEGTTEDSDGLWSLAARANYPASDCMDRQVAVKGICWGMSAPNVGDKRELGKRKEKLGVFRRPGAGTGTGST